MEIVDGMSVWMWLLGSVENDGIMFFNEISGLMSL